MNDAQRARSGGAYVAPAPQRRWPRSSSGSRQETGRRHPHDARLLLAVRAAAVPWLEPDVNDHLEDAGRAGRARRGAGARSASSPTTWRSSTTSTPRRSRPPSKLGLPAVAGRDAGHRPAVRRDGARPAARAGRRRARRGPAARRGRQPAGLRGTAARVGCCPNPRGERAGARRGRARDRPDRPTSCATWRSTSARAAAALVRERAPRRRRRSPTPSPATSTSSPRPTGPARS